jgi:lipopolysaccharide export system permease protein
MTDTKPEELLEGGTNKDVLEPLDPGKYFLHTREVDFDALTRPGTWFTLASTDRLYDELQKPDSTRLATMAVLFHMRLTRPLLGLILVLMGLSLLLRDQNRNIFLSAGLCLILCGVFFAACFASKQLGDNDILGPALAAWLPVLCFGPVSVAMFDAVHT